MDYTESILAFFSRLFEFLQPAYSFFIASPWWVKVVIVGTITFLTPLALRHWTLMPKVKDLALSRTAKSFRWHESDRDPSQPAHEAEYLDRALDIITSSSSGMKKLKELGLLALGFVISLIKTLAILFGGVAVGVLIFIIIAAILKK